MRIYIGNLPRQIDDKQLHKMALAYGKPDSANIARKLAGGASKGFAFIEYGKVEEARAAIAGLHGQSVYDQVLEAREANTPEPCAPTSVLHSRD